MLQVYYLLKKFQNGKLNFNLKLINGKGDGIIMYYLVKDLKKEKKKIILGLKIMNI